MKKTVGIMGAMPEEIDGVVQLLSNPVTSSYGMRTYTSGQINGTDVVVVFSRWGKVAAAATVSTLIHQFKITELYFTGVAGALHADLGIGDVVVASRLVQHDMDARPLMARHEIPLLGKTYFESDVKLRETVSDSVSKILSNKTLHELIDADDLSEFGIVHPEMILGDIASGDQFFASNEQKAALDAVLPSVVCVEMEGAAVAQVCYEYTIPFCIIRTISDVADEQSPIDFPAFISKISSKYSTAIIRETFMRHYND